MNKNNVPTIAVAMIVKGTDDEAPTLAKCLASISRYVDAIYLNLNVPKGQDISPKIRKVAEQYTNKIFDTEWTGNFVKARNFIFDKVSKKYDFIMWLDADDTVFQPQKIKEIVAIMPADVHGLAVQYDYNHDEYGNCTVTHRPVRIVRNNGSYIWKASFEDGDITVHEILSENRTVKRAYNNQFKIIHHATQEHRQKSLQRNVEMLEKMYKHQSELGKVDPRILYYLGREYFNAGDMVNAEPVLSDYLKASGWAEERAEAWLHLGLIWARSEQIDSARQAFGHAFLENPSNPRPLVELGQLEFHAKRFNMSEEFLLMAIDKKIPDTAYAVFPTENKYRAYVLLVQTYINMGFGKLKDAQRYALKAAKVRPFEPLNKEVEEILRELTNKRNTTRAIIRLLSAYQQEDNKKKARELLKIVPEDMNDNPAVITARMKYNRVVKWPEKSIAIYCGQSAEDIWGPWSLETGIGGSEEAVIQLSNQLAELGWKVTVYGTPGARAGDYGRVYWKQYWEFNPKDVFDVLVGWRNPWFFDNEITARKKILWLHDVMEKKEFTPEIINNIDKIAFMSNYHANLYKGLIPKDKWFISGNGIDPEQFEKYDGEFKRDLHHCVYMSSHLRGLEVLYNIWPEVKEAIPDATLDVFYGWETFDSLLKDNPERMEWKRQMLTLAEKLDGVTDAGRISHDEIAQEIFKSGILAYPCTFPEVYNISTVKAIAGGAYPILSDYACLTDYKEFSTQVHLGKSEEKFKKEYTKQLIKALKEPINERTRIQNMLEARSIYSWMGTAKKWDKIL